MTKVCFLSTAHDVRDKRVFEKEAVSLAAAGFEVVHVAPGENSQTVREKSVELVTFKDPNRASGGLTSLTHRLFMLWRIMAVARYQRADIYHANEFDSWLVALGLKLIYKKKIVFDVHEFYPDLLLRRGLPWPMKACLVKFVLLSYKCLAPYTDLIVFANKYIRSDFPREMKNAIDVENFGFGAKPFTPRSSTLLTETQPFTLVHVGLINAERGIFKIVEAVEQMHELNFQLVFYGKLVGTSKEAFASDVKRRGLEDRVLFRDWIPYEQLALQLAKANAGFIFFGDESNTNKYGLPHKLFDYMTAGLCIIASSRALYVSRLVTEANCGISLDPDDTLTVARTLDELVRNRSLSNTYGQRAALAVSTMYCWESEAVKLVDAYRRLV